NNQTGEQETRDLRHVFIMTGAAPNTRWLDGCVVTDDKGFIKTGRDLQPEELGNAKWSLSRPPFILETSLPGVFAVGDVRCGNIKRVAAAVGEGSAAINMVHQVLHEYAFSPRINADREFRRRFTRMDADLFKRWRCEALSLNPCESVLIRGAFHHLDRTRLDHGELSRCGNHTLKSEASAGQ